MRSIKKLLGYHTSGQRDLVTCQLTDKRLAFFRTKPCTARQSWLLLRNLQRCLECRQNNQHDLPQASRAAADVDFRSLVDARTGRDSKLNWDQAELTDDGYHGTWNVHFPRRATSNLDWGTSA